MEEKKTTKIQLLIQNVLSAYKQKISVCYCSELNFSQTNGHTTNIKKKKKNYLFHLSVGWMETPVYLRAFPNNNLVQNNFTIPKHNRKGNKKKNMYKTIADVPFSLVY